MNKTKSLGIWQDEALQAEKGARCEVCGVWNHEGNTFHCNCDDIADVMAMENIPFRQWLDRVCV